VLHSLGTNIISFIEIKTWN